MNKVRTRNKYKTFREIEKEDRIFGNYKVKCKCSHVVLFTRGKDRIICSHCGNYIYKDKKN